VDKAPVTEVKRWEADMHAYLESTQPEILQAITRTQDLTQETIDALRVALEDFNKSWTA
jgi:F0F1-type ATP synthase alpha subunit